MAHQKRIQEFLKFCVFFAAVRYSKNLALVEGSVEILPSKKLKSRMN